MAKKKYTPTSDVQLEQRVEFVKGLIANFVPRRIIIDKTVDKFKVSPTSVDKYIHLAKAELKKEIDKAEFAGILLSNFQFLYQKNIKEQDYKEAHALLKSMGLILDIGRGNTEGRIELDTSKKVQITFFD